MILYPKENNKQYNEYKEQSQNDCSTEIIFKEIESITEILDIVFE